MLSYVILFLGARKRWIEEESRLGALTQLCDPLNPRALKKPNICI